MPDAIKTSLWKRQLKTHDKAKRRLITGSEAAKRDANTRKRDEEKRLHKAQTSIAKPSELLRRRPFHPQLSVSSDDKKEEEDKDEKEDKEEEKEEKEALMPPPLTALAALQVLRAERKRALTIKALEAEKAPKRGTGQRGGRGRGRGGKETK